MYTSLLLGIGHPRDQHQSEIFEKIKIKNVAQIFVNNINIHTSINLINS